MAFFRTPEVEWLYSGVTKTNPSNRPMVAAHSWVCGVLVLAHGRRQGLVQVRQGVVDEVDQLELGVRAPPGLVHHPAGRPARRGGRGGCFRG